MRGRILSAAHGGLTHRKIRDQEKLGRTMPFEAFSAAAEQGYAGAQSNLGFIYEQGRGVAQNYAAAGKWYRKAAERGNAGAQNNLGLMYANGEGVPQDYAAAMKWFCKAAVVAIGGYVRRYFD